MPENSSSVVHKHADRRGGGGDRSGFVGSKAAERLRRSLRGDLRTDDLTLGVYSTDASIYQVRPLAVVLPRSDDDIAATLAVARQEGIPVTPRGAGTSQGGQAVGAGIVVDTSRYLSRVSNIDVAGKSVVVEPGVVLDQLNRKLEPTGLFFPVDVATASRATLGGMAGNNSAGARSIRYGMMADNVRAIDTVMVDGSMARFGGRGRGSRVEQSILRPLQALRRREADELDRRVPKVLRHVAGYGLHRVGEDGSSLADLLVGSEGTLAFFTSIELALVERPAHRVLGVCHFPSLHGALAAVEDIVELEPTAVELTDGTMITLARGNPEFSKRVERFVHGDPGALLFVEFAGDSRSGVLSSLEALEALAAVEPGPVVRADTAELQAEVWAVRKAGMNIAMSGRSARKPVSIIEDCAIPLDRLAEWGDRLQEIFRAHEVDGTWYAHASVGCLHVRPSLDLKDASDVVRLRVIAEEAQELVRALGGSHSGEHGDGRIRSEFIEPMLGARLAGAFGEVKDLFDPERLLNPGIIVDPVPMDDRSTFRYSDDYAELPVVTSLDWSADEGLLTAVERCNNNGACRKHDPGVMCPSFRATREEVASPRGRANTLRLALTGQLGESALASPEVKDALDLCVGCKACRRECPTGVDVARLKVEAMSHWHSREGIPLRTRLFADLPKQAPRASRFGRAANAIGRSGMARRLLGRLGLAADRPLPQWARKPFRDEECGTGGRKADVLLLADTFNRWFEPENLRAAIRVLGRAGRHPRTAAPSDASSRPLCCGRTYLSAGMVEEAREELARSAAVLVPFIDAGGVVVGLEPSCVLTFRDEAAALLPAQEAEVLARGTLLLEEYLVRDLGVPATPSDDARLARVHGHCHQKAFGVDASVGRILESAGTRVEPIVSGCCGMAGSFGYEAEHADVSRAMAALDLIPALAEDEEDSVVVANGFSCRHQIRDLTGRPAVHVVRVLDKGADPP